MRWIFLALVSIHVLMCSPPPHPGWEGDFPNHPARLRRAGTTVEAAEGGGSIPPLFAPAAPQRGLGVAARS